MSALSGELSQTADAVARSVRALKAKLSEGRPVSIINPDHPAPSLVEVLGKLGFDGVFLDCEHGSAHMERIEDMARAARVQGIASILRPDHGAPWIMTRYLHRGIGGLMVPLVHDRATAQSVVDTVRYACPDDYEDRFVVLMIESAAGVANLDEILKVEGVDVFFVGPGDLSQSMGYPLRVWEGQERAPEVVQAIDRAFKTILDAGKTAGTLVNRSDVRDFVSRGILYLYEHASHFLATGAAEYLSRVRDASAR